MNFTYNKGAISSTLPKMDQFEPLDYAVEPDFQVIIGFDDAYIAEREVLYQAERQEFLWLMSIFVVSLILAAIGMLLSCISAGRKKDNEGVQLLPIDAFWIDAHFLLLLVVETLVVAAIVFFYDQVFSAGGYADALCCQGSVGVKLSTVIGANFKDRRFGERLLFLKLIKKGWGFIKTSSRNWLSITMMS